MRVREREREEGEERNDEEAGRCGASLRGVESKTR